MNQKELGVFLTAIKNNQQTLERSMKSIEDIVKRNVCCNTEMASVDLSGKLSLATTELTRIVAALDSENTARQTFLTAFKGA